MNDNNTLIKEAYRLAEQRLESQFSSAKAADQRAVSTASMLVGAAAVLAALADNAASPATLLLGSSGLAMAAFLAWYSARPVDIYAPGARFDDLAEDIKAGRDMIEVMTELGQFHDKHTRSNDAQMARSAQQVKWAFYIATASVGLTIFGQIIALLCA